MENSYIVEPRKFDDQKNLLAAQSPENADVFRVYAKNLDENASFNTAWTKNFESSVVGQDTARHLYDFSTEKDAQAFVDRLKVNEPSLEALKNGEPVVVAGVTYTDHGNYYYADAVNEKPYTMPIINRWEIERYLSAGELSPELFANAAEQRPQNLPMLDAFDRQAMLNFVDFARRNERLEPYHELEPYPRHFTQFDLPKEARNFIANPVLPEMSPDAGPQAPSVTTPYERVFSEIPASIIDKNLYYIQEHPAMKAYLEMANKENMPEAIKADYARKMFDNNPELVSRYETVNRYAGEAVEARSGLSQFYDSGKAKTAEYTQVQEKLNNLKLPDSPNGDLAAARATFNQDGPSMVPRKP